MATAQNKSLVYIAPSRASFVDQDIKCLDKEYDLSVFIFSGKNKLLVPLEAFKLFWFLLRRRKQVYLCSFGGYHSFIVTLVAKWKGCRSYIIMNGTDSVAIPEFSYGHLRKGMLRWCCKKSYGWADGLLPVSESLMGTLNNYAFTERPLGLRAVFPDNTWNYEVVPNGFNAEFWRSDTKKDPKSVLTVATATRVPHKGVDLMLEVAQMMKDYTFSIAGIERLENCPENVTCLGYLSLEELRRHYGKHQFYLQLSIWEGFGCALCEAMLCGCTPIVSNVNMLPEIVGEDRLVLAKRSATKLKEIFDTAGSIESTDFRHRIIDRFAIEERISSLRKVIDGE